ncbi:MAG: hypothetical protein ACO20H_05175 [Bacteriovoracaceae bacterium]
MIWPFRKKQYKIQSFTYYIPAPNQGRVGYREKHFDRVFYEFINKGFEIISINTQSDSSSNRGGFWIICVVRAKNRKSEELNLSEYGPFSIPGEEVPKPETFQDLYHIEE